MNTNSQLLLLLTLFLCLLTLLSCTAPDKQHQKQHSHQPQRKHPFTCSGIYLLNPPSATPTPLSVLYPFPYFFTFVWSSCVFLWLAVALCLVAALLVVKVSNQQAVSRTVAGGGSGGRTQLAFLRCRAIFSRFESLPERNREPEPAGAVGTLYPFRPVRTSADERLPAAPAVKDLKVWSLHPRVKHYQAWNQEFN